MALQLELNSINVIPGKLLCRTCYRELFSEKEETSSQEESEPECEQSAEFNENEKRQKLDDSLCLLGVSPVKLKGVKQSEKHLYLDKKNSKVVQNIHENVVEAYDINADISEQGTSNSSQSNKAEEKLLVDYYTLLE